MYTKSFSKVLSPPTHKYKKNMLRRRMDEDMSMVIRLIIVCATWASFSFIRYSISTYLTFLYVCACVRMQHPMECGVPRTIQNTIQKRIIGGRIAPFASLPWQAHIRIAEYQCGGVLGKENCHFSFPLHNMFQRIFRFSKLQYRGSLLSQQPIASNRRAWKISSFIWANMIHRIPAKCTNHCRPKNTTFSAKSSIPISDFASLNPIATIWPCFN